MNVVNFTPRGNPQADAHRRAANVTAERAMTADTIYHRKQSRAWVKLAQESLNSGHWSVAQARFAKAVDELRQSEHQS